MTNKVNSYGWKAEIGSAVVCNGRFRSSHLGFISLGAISADLNLTPAQGGSLVTDSDWCRIWRHFILSDKYGRVRVPIGLFFFLRCLLVYVRLHKVIGIY